MEYPRGTKAKETIQTNCGLERTSLLKSRMLWPKLRPVNNDKQLKKTSHWFTSERFLVGRGERIWTSDLCVPNAALYRMQIKHTHFSCCFKSRWSGRHDLNVRPLRPERSAPPNWATPRWHLIFIITTKTIIQKFAILCQLVATGRSLYWPSFCPQWYYITL